MKTNAADFFNSLQNAQNSFSQSDYDAAELWFQNALEQAERSHSSQSSEYAFVALNLTDFLCQMGRYDEARPLLRAVCSGISLIQPV